MGLGLGAVLEFDEERFWPPMKGRWEVSVSGKCGAGRRF